MNTKSGWFIFVLVRNTVTLEDGVARRQKYVLRNPGTLKEPNSFSVTSEKDNRIYTTSSPVSGVGIVVQPRLLSRDWRVREFVGA
jgi:hypothetical protein